MTDVARVDQKHTELTNNVICTLVKKIDESLLQIKCDLNKAMVAKMEHLTQFFKEENARKDNIITYLMAHQLNPDNKQK